MAIKIILDVNSVQKQIDNISTIIQSIADEPDIRSFYSIRLERIIKRYNPCATSMSYVPNHPPISTGVFISAHFPSDNRYTYIPSIDSRDSIGNNRDIWKILESPIYIGSMCQFELSSADKYALSDTLPDDIDSLSEL